MKRRCFIVLLTTTVLVLAWLTTTACVTAPSARAGQVPFGTATSPDIPISHRDRVYTADQWSNTVTVTDPVDNTLLGVIRLGDPTPANLSPLYYGQVLVHGMGFSPDHRTLLVVSIASNSVAFIDTATNAVKHITYVGRSPHEAFFTPDGKQVWFTLKDTGKTEVFDARPPFAVLKTLETGPITNHVNIVHNVHGTFAYVTIGGLGEVQVFRTDTFAKVATIPVGALPHGLWPSGDGTRLYVGLENGDRLVAIDTLTNQVLATSPIGQGCQAITYVPNAVPSGTGTQGLVSLGIAEQATHLSLVPLSHGKPATGQQAPTSVSLFDQGLVQVLQAAVTGLEPNHPYLLALSQDPNGGGALEPLEAFRTNQAGAAIVNTVGPIRQVVQGEDNVPRRYLVIVPGTAQQHGTPVQVQAK
jgi:YVTN family beta-propeller protein